MAKVYIASSGAEFGNLHSVSSNIGKRDKQFSRPVDVRAENQVTPKTGCCSSFPVTERAARAVTLLLLYESVCG